MEANRKEYSRLNNHLWSMQIALQASLDPNHKYCFNKGTNYFRKQIEITTQKLKSYGK